MNPKKALLWGLWVTLMNGDMFQSSEGASGSSDSAGHTITLT